jgi:aryl-alcohol dehydrogenase-like predicted oxidoreductase
MGGMTFGREMTEADSHRLMDRFVDAGGNFFDTADVYMGGLSEEIMGRWLKESRATILSSPQKCISPRKQPQ